MDPVTIATLAISIGLRLTEAIQRYQTANTALGAMLAEGRGPTVVEIEALMEAGATVDGRLEDLVGK